MTKKRDDDDAVLGTLGAIAVGGPGLAGGYALGGLFSEGPARSRELGPAPIGSDPWLVAEVKRALGGLRDVDVSDISVDAKEAIVTVSGAVDAGDEAKIEAAARTVQGTKRLQMSLATR